MITFSYKVGGWVQQDDYVIKRIKIITEKWIKYRFPENTKLIKLQEKLPVFNMKTYLDSIYPFEEVTDEAMYYYCIKFIYEYLVEPQVHQNIFFYFH